LVSQGLYESKIEPEPFKSLLLNLFLDSLLKEVIMNLSPAYEQWLEQTLSQGCQEGRQELRQKLHCAFSPEEWQ
jgi:hypothetical protein